MDVRTYRARSLQEALRLIREDLGPDAAVLHTRELSAGMLGGLFGGRQIEVTASNEVNVPSRLPPKLQPAAVTTKIQPSAPSSAIAPRSDDDFKARVRANLQQQHKATTTPNEVQDKVTSTAELFHSFTDLIDAGMSEKVARELLEGVKRRLSPRDWSDPLLLQSHLTRLVEESLRIRGPIQWRDRLGSGTQCKKVALVGPTGVGKTTTIAKLAANYRLKEKCRVGLITVDTYRIAAVDQLRTYAEIIDLPMEVVATPREMREATERFAELDLVFIDTAGRSSRDETQIQELRSLLAEAHADEVHLVLSAVTALDTQLRSAERFAAVGASHMILTKIDEAFGLGALYPLFQHCELPLTYLTDGQNVPHDIRPAERRAFARLLLGMEQDSPRGFSSSSYTSAQT